MAAAFLLGCGGGGASLAPPPSPTPTATATPSPTPPRLQYGDPLFSLDLSDPKRLPALPTGVSWLQNGPGGKPCIQLDVPTTSTTKAVAIKFPLDIEAMQGMHISVECRIKAEGVTQPAQNYNGVKCMLVYETPTTYINKDDVYGTFDWTRFSFNWQVSPTATKGSLVLTLQDCTGRAWITDVLIRVLHPAAKRPALDPNATTPDRGHIPMRGVDTSRILNAKDFEDLAGWKVNLVRWQVIQTDPAILQDATAYDAWLEASLRDLDTALVNARKNGIKLVIDLHSPPGGALEDGAQRLFQDSGHANRFIAAWQKIALRYKGNNTIFAYDLLNEPIQWSPTPLGVLDWQGLLIAAAKAIRAIDPDAYICFPVDGGDEPLYFTWLSALEVPRILYTVHMYLPHEFTHQGIKPQWGVVGSQSYPGQYNGQPFNKESLRATLKPVRDFQMACRVPILVGEFSAVRWADGAAQYLQDLTDLFEEYGWDWAYHAFREYPGWDLEMENAYDVTKKAVAPTDRMQVIRKRFDQNQLPF